VLASEAEREPFEGGTDCRGGVEGDLQVGWLVHPARFGVEFERDLDLVSFVDTSRGAVRCADADQVPPALRRDAAAPRVAVEVIATFGRFPSPSAPMTSAGTSAPVALPAGTTVERKVLAVNVLSLRDAGDVALGSSTTLSVPRIGWPGRPSISRSPNS
jgi:hypothetical protein